MSTETLPRKGAITYSVRIQMWPFLITRPFLQDFKMMPSFSVANVVPGLPFSNMTEQ
jgi:hypothetical protein